MKVKVCGITNINDALLCEALGADALGFIFYNNSKRYIDFEGASRIISRLSFFTHKIGVFVNETEDMVNFLADKLRLTGVQLSGDESPVYVQKINCQVIKSFRIDENFDFDIISQYKNVIPLLDTYKSNEYGGTGEVFNWYDIPEDIRKTAMVAGGVSEKNIDEIFFNIKPAAVDLSSSLEIQPGKKDGVKVKSFFDKINKLRSSQW